MSDDADLNTSLLIAAGERDEAAFAELFDRLAPLVLGYLIRYLRNREEAEEVLQEVFLQVWNQAARYQPRRSSAKGWVFLLARSRALDRIRSRDARVRREEATAVDGAAAAPAPDLHAVEKRLEVEKVLEVLSPDQRDCVRMSFYEGLSLAQIADRTDVPLGTIKSRFFYGMRKLRASFGGHDA